MSPASYAIADVIDYICQWFEDAELAEAEWRIVAYPSEGYFKAWSDALYKYLDDDKPVIITYQQLMEWLPLHLNDC